MLSNLKILTQPIKLLDTTVPIKQTGNGIMSGVVTRACISWSLSCYCCILSALTMLTISLLLLIKDALMMLMWIFFTEHCIWRCAQCVNADILGRNARLCILICQDKTLLILPSDLSIVIHFCLDWLLIVVIEMQRVALNCNNKRFSVNDRDRANNNPPEAEILFEMWVKWC